MWVLNKARVNFQTCLEKWKEQEEGKFYIFATLFLAHFTVKISFL